MKQKQTSDALSRIETNFTAFKSALRDCQEANVYSAANLEDTYARFGRVRSRFENEVRRLPDSERQALSKVFVKDRFCEGIMNIRHVAEHIKKRTDFTIFTTSNTPIGIAADSSARSVFSGLKALVKTSNGDDFMLDHIQLLREIERRVESALKRAKGS